MKIIGVGRNYSAHAKELGNEVPEEPIIFLKPETAILKNNDHFYYPSFSNNIHFEVELVIRICKVGKNIEQRFAPKYYDAIGIGIDFTARDLQDIAKAKSLPWTISKGFNGSAPISDFIPVSEFKDLKNIEFSLLHNGKPQQQGNSSDMMHSFEKIIAYVSQFITLKIGDLIYTGTPSGVGAVQIGDKLEAFIGDRKMLECNIK